jgi:hypothetical protein
MTLSNGEFDALLARAETEVSHTSLYALSADLMRVPFFPREHRDALKRVMSAALVDLGVEYLSGGTAIAAVVLMHMCDFDQLRAVPFVSSLLQWQKLPQREFVDAELALFDAELASQLPKLAAHLQKLQVTSSLFAITPLLSMCSLSFKPTVSHRVLTGSLKSGLGVAFRNVMLAFLRSAEKELLAADADSFEAAMALLHEKQKEFDFE